MTSPGGLHQEVAAGVILIDTMLGGKAGANASYLLMGERPFVIETGPARAWPRLSQALVELGVGPGELAGVVVSHVHLDHAGAAGEFARNYPNALIYVHPVGARHLADPSKLVSSARRVFGSRLDELFGEPLAVPEAQLAIAENGAAIELGGGRRLEVLHAPGHAKHHLVVVDSESGTLFSGDAAGILLAGMNDPWPATPPPDFDLELSVDSLRLVEEVGPERIALSHFGVCERPAWLVERARLSLLEWSRVAKEAVELGRDVEAELRAAFGSGLLGLGEGLAESIEALNGFASNAAGLERWARVQRLGV